MDSMKTEVLVVGGGPGGYTAAFYAADRGKKVVLVEKEERLGGVCLNAGCIPSKSLLHATRLIAEGSESAKRGISFVPPEVDAGRLRLWKDSVLEKLGQGIAGLAKRRGVELIRGRGYFENSRLVRVETSEGQKFVEFDHAIVAVGSLPAMPQAFDLGNPRIMTSTEALQIEDIPGELLIVGGGYIGMELGTVYASLGSKVTLAEALDSILAGADPDLVRPVKKYAETHFKEVRVKAKVLKMATERKQIKVDMEVNGELRQDVYDRVLVSIGRVPNAEDLGLENTKVTRDSRGFIQVNPRQQTEDPFIYAIGDIVGGALLAHKASKEARVAVEVLMGEASEFKDWIVPAVVFTDPEIAWCGLTEAEARQKGIQVHVVRFPWSASGRALSFDRTDGMTKMIIEPGTERVLGLGLCGAGAGELIAEGVLAVEMGATARDLAECIHPHPTLSETIMECAEMFYGHATHAYTRPRAHQPEA